MYWYQIILYWNNKIESKVANFKRKSYEIYWSVGDVMIHLGFFCLILFICLGFFSVLQIFKYAGWARMSCYTLDNLKNEVLQNTRSSTSMDFSQTETLLNLLWTMSWCTSIVGAGLWNVLKVMQIFN